MHVKCILYASLFHFFFLLFGCCWCLSLLLITNPLYFRNPWVVQSIDKIAQIKQRPNKCKTKHERALARARFFARFKLKESKKKKKYTKFKIETNTVRAQRIMIEQRAMRVLVWSVVMNGVNSSTFWTCKQSAAQTFKQEARNRARWKSENVLNVLRTHIFCTIVIEIFIE